MSATQLDSWSQHSMSRLLVSMVSQYLKDKEHRREFESWYLRKYGKPYQWKKGNEVYAQK